MTSLLCTSGTRKVESLLALTTRTQLQDQRLLRIIWPFSGWKFQSRTGTRCQWRHSGRFETCWPDLPRDYHHPVPPEMGVRGLGRPEAIRLPQGGWKISTLTLDLFLDSVTLVVTICLFRNGWSKPDELHGKIISVQTSTSGFTGNCPPVANSTEPRKWSRRAAYCPGQPHQNPAGYEAQ